MRKLLLLTLLFLLFNSLAILAADPKMADQKQNSVAPDILKLPQPKKLSNVCVEQVLGKRGKNVSSSTKILTYAEVAQLLWAGYGYSNLATQVRTLESQDGAYSLMLYVVTTNSVYRYLPTSNSVEKISDLNVVKKLSEAAKKDANIYSSTFNIIVAGSAKRAGYKIPRNGNLYMMLEAGRACQNIELQAVSMGLSVKATSNFEPKKIKALLKIATSYDPLAVLTISKTSPSNAYGFEHISSESETAKQTKPAVPKRVVLIVPERKVLEEEFFNIQSLLQLADITVDIASSTLDEIRGDLRGTIRPNILIRDVYASDYDGVILIGGVTSKKQYKDESIVTDIVREFYDDGDTIGALGRTPRLLAFAKIVDNVKVTSHLSQRKELQRVGGIWTNTPIEVSGKIITAQGSTTGSGTSATEGVSGVTRFASEFVKVLKGTQTLLQGNTPVSTPFAPRENMRRESFEN